MLTNQLVRPRTGRPRRPHARSGRAGRGAVVVEQGSRDRLLAAAASEFAARGFAGANVDRIARAARLNKAMIYYHFKSKAALYQEILGDMFHAVAARIRSVAASGAAPDVKLKAFVEAIATEAEARPHFPPIWFREIAEGGVHLGDDTLHEIAQIVQTLVRILQDGVRARRFRRVNPLLVHGSIIGPLLLFFASGRVRQRMQRAGLRGIAELTRDDVVSHVQQMTLGFVEGRM
jgi:TetR/AcrR family transcriptional regulator